MINCIRLVYYSYRGRMAREIKFIRLYVAEAFFVFQIAYAIAMCIALIREIQFSLHLEIFCGNNIVDNEERCCTGGG